MSQTDPMIDRTFSHYRVLEKIGEGGMGEVFLAEDTKLKRRVALKFLPEDLTRDPERKERFVQEARAAAAIEHPYIAAVHDIDEVDGRTFIAMEHVGGESLRDAIRGRKLTVRKCLDIVIQVADGLTAAHQRGIVHRDLKPENVLLSEQGYPKIIDFGLAKLLEPLTKGLKEEPSGESETKLKTRKGLIMGTVSYMSPEQARGASIDPRSDIFSFGILLHEMLSGDSPFSRGTAVETLSAILKENPPPLTLSTGEAPAELHRILRRAMAKDPDERYQSVKDLAIDLKELRDTLTSAERPAVSDSRRAFASLRTTGLGLAALSFVALAAVAVYFGARRKTREPGIGASGRPAIAVMYFEDHTGAEEIRWLSTGLPSMLLTGLAQTPGLDVVSSQRIHEILKEVGQGNVERIDKALVADVARRAGAGAVVIGSIFKAGNEVRIDVQIEDVASGRILSAESVRGADVFPLVDELTGRIRTSLNLTDRPGGRPIAEVTTASLDAYRVFDRGWEAYRNLRYLDAREALEEAIRLDPSFAMAYYALSNVSRAMGDDEAERKYRELAMAHIDRLPERERLLVEADYAHQPAADYRKSIGLLEKLLERYPDTPEAYQGLGHIYSSHLGDSGKALEAIERGVAAVPRSGPLQNEYGYDLLRAGRYPEAIRAFETYASLEPDEPNPHDSLGETYLLSGQPEKSLELYRRALEINPRFYSAHGGRTFALGILGRYDEALQEMAVMKDAFVREGVYLARLSFMEAFVLSRVGRYREAQDAIARGVELASNPDQRAGFHFLSAIVALERGDAPSALERLRPAFELEPELNQGAKVGLRLVSGVAHVRLRELEAAEADLASQRRTYDGSIDSQNWWHRALEGEIALARGDLDAADVAFFAGEPKLKMSFNNVAPELTVFANNLLWRDGRARVKAARGDARGAVELYRDLLTPDIGNKWTAFLEPRYVLAQARLLDEVGEKGAARTQYERFLALWKNADPGLPELTEARRP